MSGREEDKNEGTSGPEAFQQQLHDYQNRIANILESFTDAFFEVDSNWVVTYWNKEAERLLQMPREKIIGQNLWDVYADAVPLKFFQEYHRAVTHNIAVRFEEYFAPRALWVEVAAFPSGSSLSVYFKDITANKNAMALLQAERKKYSDLFNQSPLPQWVYDFGTLAFLDVNNAAINHYGYSRQEFLNMTIKDIRPAEEVQHLERILSTKVESGLLSKSSVKHKKKNGDVISVHVEGNSVHFEGKQARLVIVIDRTAEIKAVMAMEESVQRFNIVSKATSDAIWDWNIATGEMLWNQGIKGIFGHADTAYTEKWWQDHVHPDDLENVLGEFHSLVENQSELKKAEYRFRCADGSYRFVLDRSFIIFDSEGKPERMIGSMQDITERVNDLKAIQEQNLRLREISWIQSHKVRSPLAQILSLVELLAAAKADPDTIAELIPHIEKSAKELDNVVKEIVLKAV